MIILTDTLRDLKQDLDECDTTNDLLNNSDLLFSLDLDFNNPYIQNNLRRWCMLWINFQKDGIKCFKYRGFIIDWLRGIKDEGVSSSRPLNYTPKLVLESEKTRVMKNFFETKSFLIKNNIIENEPARKTDMTEDLIKYDCDIYNYLEELYPNLVNIVLEYDMLGEKKKNMIKDFYEIKTRDNQISFLRNNGEVEITDLADFLPDWCIFSLLISEDDLRKSNEKNLGDLPEFRNKKKIDDKDFLRHHKDLLIREEIFKSFGINEVWSGAKIKEKIREIYTQFEYTEGKPRISEINKYFEVNKTRQGYRIGFRKLIKYN
jgi:hypothetical protein